MKPLMKGGLLIMAISTVMVIYSDTFIRARGLDGQFGLSARAYDVTATLLLVAGLWAFWTAVQSHRREDNPVISRTVYLLDSASRTEDVDAIIDTLRQLVMATLGRVQMTVVEQDSGLGVRAHLNGRQDSLFGVLDSLRTHLDNSDFWMEIDK